MIMMWNGSEENGKVGSSYKEDEGTDFEDEDSDTEWQRKTEFDMLYVLNV